MKTNMFVRWPSSLCLVMLGLAVPLAAQTYQPPASPRDDINLDSGWRFIRQDVTGAEAVGFVDASWTNLNLPHTWNNLDGQDGGNNYYRGIGWYRRHVMVDGSETNREFFLKFDGANIVSDVYVNGTFLGEHRGGFAAFVFDVTPYLNIGGDNVIAVKVSNASFSDVPPLSADFTFFGGIYREVHLLATDRLNISPLDYGSPGVYWQATKVSASNANLQVTTVVSNADTAPRTAVVKAFVVDAESNIVAELTNFVTLSAGSASNVATSATITNPHLWDGLSDPYLYRIYVELGDGTNLADLVSQPLGFRWFRLDPTNGFFLNGHPYDLHGVNMHQDWLNRGWAISHPERVTNFMFIKEIGATVVRLCHYEHDDDTYQLADQNGVVLWSEVPLVNAVTASDAFNSNAVQQLTELIRQRRNHPSVICWGVFNEESASGADTIISNLVQTAHREDPTRPATCASNKGINTPINWMPDVTAFNEYYGWYGGTTADFAPFVDNLHATYPARSVGISEYGAGASIYQHSEDPVSAPPPYGTPHPEEWQNQFHEAYWIAIKQRPFLWIKTIWNLFDFAVDSRNEGDTPGRNDKGLVTYDRRVRKDAFYFYKANWTTNPMVYITGHTFTNRLANSITAKVYANCDSVELFLNGVSQGSRTGTNSVFTWPVTLSGGSNFVQATGTKDTTNVTDSLVWIAPTPPPLVSLVTPVGGVASLHSTNDILLVSVNVSNPVPANPLTTAWLQSSGPGVAAFADSNALATAVSFSADGIYRLDFTANNGAVTDVAVLVLVNTDVRLTNGLAAWWKMDETGGSTAFDSSGNGRNAALTGASFTTGYLSNALQLAGSSGSYGNYSASDGNQVTLAAWVKASGNGGGGYPFIVGSPSYRFIFRFTGTDSSSVGFATWDGVNGDWDSGAGTIAQGTWYHVAVSYDRNHLSTPPVFYINGKKMTTAVLASPSGTPPPFTGTGYIGNRYDGARGWNGLIDDLRIYNRILSDSEIQTLAAAPPANLAPVVDAGTNQTVIWPASAGLNGSATDDGKPSGVVTTTWSQLSGHGAVTFADANAVATTASFPAPGTYELQLAADDGQVETVGNVTVTAVTPAISIQSLPGTLQLSWPTNAGAWRLQAQTNPLNFGLGTNWGDVSGAAVTNPLIVPMDSTNGSVFYRLIHL
jgi:beta-galactosidase